MKVDIPGLIEQGEFDALTEYAGLVDPGSKIVEFGCYLGRSTSAILKGANSIKDAKILYSMLSAQKEMTLSRKRWLVMFKS